MAFLKQELGLPVAGKRPDTTRSRLRRHHRVIAAKTLDYQYNKKLREIDRRVRYLRKRLEDVQ